jgi:hypothetical protein
MVSGATPKASLPPLQKAQGWGSLSVARVEKEWASRPGALPFAVFETWDSRSQQLHLERSNELNPGHNLADKPFIVCQKQIGAGLGCAGKMDGICRGHA